MGWDRMGCNTSSAVMIIRVQVLHLLMLMLRLLLRLLLLSSSPIFHILSTLFSLLDNNPAPATKYAQDNYCTKCLPAMATRPPDPGVYEASNMIWGGATLRRHPYGTFTYIQYRHVKEWRGSEASGLRGWSGLVMVCVGGRQNGNPHDGCSPHHLEMIESVCMHCPPVRSQIHSHEAGFSYVRERRDETTIVV